MKYGGRFMNKMMFTVIAWLITANGIALAGKMPDGIGDIKLGQQNVASKKVSKVKFMGYSGSLDVFSSDDGVVNTLRFFAGGCTMEDEKRCSIRMKKLHTKFLQEFGKPKKEGPENIVWELDGKLLTVEKHYTGGEGRAIYIFLEIADETRRGGKNDGFKEFYLKFTKAYNSSNREQLITMMKFPFEENCGAEIRIKDEDSFDGNLKGTLKMLNPKLEVKPVFNRTWSFGSYYSAYDGNGFRFSKTDGKWLAEGYSCSD
jgi:hypothetical protein